MLLLSIKLGLGSTRSKEYDLKKKIKTWIGEIENISYCTEVIRSSKGVIVWNLQVSKANIEKLVIKLNIYETFRRPIWNIIEVWGPMWKLLEVQDQY